jgi:hypothetical protein
MLKNAPALLLFGLLTGCKMESAASRADSVVAHASSPATSPTLSARYAGAADAKENQESYAELAGDTLQLVSIGGHELPDAAIVPPPCDSTRALVPRRILMAADSSYWALTDSRPTCRDTMFVTSVTEQYRGGYRIFGDTLLLNLRDPFSGARQFVGMIFPDSVVQTAVTSDETLRFSRQRGAYGDPAAVGPVTTDTLFLVRDLDGSGKTDYIVRESRPGRNQSAKDYRLAIYLDAKPGSRAPNWANNWDEMEIGAQQGLQRAYSIAPGASLVDLWWNFADADGDELLVVERGKVRSELTHVVDYGEGVFSITQPEGQTVVEATLGNRNLKVDGALVTGGADMKCPGAQMSAVRLTYDSKSGHFTAGPRHCVQLPRD